MRDYGLPDSDVLTKPVAKPIQPGSAFVQCPNCGCEQMMEISLQVKQDLIASTTATGTYVGCPACPFASPMIIVGNKD